MAKAHDGNGVGGGNGVSDGDGWRELVKSDLWDNEKMSGWMGSRKFQKNKFDEKMSD